MSKQSLEISLAGLKIDSRSKVSLSVQVYNLFRDLILSQRLRPGNRLPATRNLAIELGISRTIITQGFEQLIMEGYVVGKPGSGTYVAYEIPDNLIAANLNGREKFQKNPPNHKSVELSIKDQVLVRNSEREEIIPFLNGTPAMDFFPYKIWFQVAKQEIKQLKKYHLGYEDASGYMPLRQEIANYLRLARAVKCEANQIIIVNGAQQGLNIAVQCLLSKRDLAWMEDPGYHGAKFAFSQNGVKICPVPIEQDGLNINYGIDKYGKAKLAYVTPSHQYPLGGTMSLTKRFQLLKWAAKNKMWILEDDYDSELRYNGRPLSSLQGLDNTGRVIYIGTFSKILFPGLRLAYLVLPNEEMVNKFKKVKAMVDRQSPILDQLLLTKFMKDGHFLRHIRKMRLLYSQRKDILCDLINDELGNYLEIVPTDAGMNLRVKFKNKIDIQIFRNECANHKLTVSIISDYTLKHFGENSFLLGFSAFSKYKLKEGVIKLKKVIMLSEK
jgi:GntR family transcriptional regulator/MocR family aminotransferase